MNHEVDRMVEALFDGVEMNQDALALMEEVKTNCREHYGDLIERGYSPTQALSAIGESLRGMEEVVSSLPRAAEGALPAEIAAPAPACAAAAGTEPAITTGPENVTDLATVTDLEVLFKSFSLEAEPSPDGRVHLDIPEEAKEYVDVTRRGNCLTLREKTDGYSGAFRLLNRFLNGMIGTAGEATVRLALPGVVGRANLKTASGDICWQGPVKTMEANTLSGDLAVTVPRNVPAGGITLSTASGDCRLEADAGRADIRTTSGDIRSLGIQERLRAVSMSGDICTDHNGQEVEIRSTSGDVNLATSAGKVQVNTVSGDITCRLNAPAGRVQIHSVSGDTNLRLPAEADIRLNTHTVSGDVTTGQIRILEPAAIDVSVSTVSGDIAVTGA